MSNITYVNCCIVDLEDIPNAQKSPGIGYKEKTHGVLEKKKTLFGIFIWLMTLSITI